MSTREQRQGWREEAAIHPYDSVRYRAVLILNELEATEADLEDTKADVLKLEYLAGGTLSEYDDNRFAVAERKANLADELAAALSEEHAGSHWWIDAPRPTCPTCALLARYQEASR